MMGEGQAKNENMWICGPACNTQDTKQFHKETLKVIENCHPMMNNNYLEIKHFFLSVQLIQVHYLKKKIHDITCLQNW